MEKIKIPAIIGDPSIMFTGTDDEIEEFENQEENCKNAWRVLVEKFTAFEFRKGIHHIIFSGCPDNNGKFRLSFFWDGKTECGDVYDEIPVMHENYKDNYSGNCEDLLSRLAGYCINCEIIVTAI